MAGTAEVLDQLRRITSSLQRIAECLVCLEAVKVPFKLCTRGHMMCCDCVRSLRVCPVCQAEFSIENPVCVKNFLATLPRFCRNSSEGCQAVVECGSDHEALCGTKRESCRQWGCNSVVPVFQMVKHYEAEHPERLLIRQERQRFIWPNFLNFHVERQDVIPVYLNNTLFWILLKNDVEEKQLKISFQAVPCSQRVDDCYINLENSKRSHSYTLKAVFKKENGNLAVDKSVSDDNDCIIIDDDDDCVIIDDVYDCTFIGNDKESQESFGSDEEQLCTRIPHGELQQFLNEDMDLEFNLTYFQKDFTPNVCRPFFSS